MSGNDQDNGSAGNAKHDRSARWSRATGGSSERPASDERGDNRDGTSGEAAPQDPRRGVGDRREGQGRSGGRGPDRRSPGGRSGTDRSRGGKGRAGSRERGDSDRRGNDRRDSADRGSESRGWSKDSAGRGRGPRRDDRGPRRDDRSRGPRPANDEPRRTSGPANPQRAPRSWDRTSPRNEGRERGPRAVEPELPEDITGHELDRDVWTQLRTLSKENADGVAKHLVASAVLLDEDTDAALAHAIHAAGRAGRVPAVREALGLVYYRRGEFADALREFRTARRLSGSDHLLPYMVDSERGLGRLERALDLASSAAARKLPEADNIELLIVVSGIRRDLGQPEAAVAVLNVPALQRAGNQPWAARLFYAYADALLAAGRAAEARTWFAKAAAADAAEETDADDRLDELEGFVLVDVLEEGEVDAGAGRQSPEVEPAEVGSADPGDQPAAAHEQPAAATEPYDALRNPFSDD